MANKTLIKTLVIGLISAATGYIIHLNSGMTNGTLTTFMAAWILFQFRSPEKTWENLGNFMNPILFGINTAFLTFIYSVWRNIPTAEAIQISIGAFLLGGVISLLITKYWTIGD